MIPKKSYQKGDRVFIKTFAGPHACVLLRKRYIAKDSEHKLGIDGWHAQITNQKEVNNLRKSGVPYKQGESPIVFVADWEIIKKC
tara:strand:- start:232 stop:486 length:255 start_codon:yes stop_codon:yes gene_type:complete